MGVLLSLWTRSGGGRHPWVLGLSMGRVTVWRVSERHCMKWLYQQLLETLCKESQNPMFKATLWVALVPLLLFGIAASSAPYFIECEHQSGRLNMFSDPVVGVFEDEQGFVLKGSEGDLVMRARPVGQALELQGDWEDGTHIQLTKSGVNRWQFIELSGGVVEVLPCKDVSKTVSGALSLLNDGIRDLEAQVEMLVFQIQELNAEHEKKISEMARQYEGNITTIEAAYKAEREEVLLLRYQRERLIKALQEICSGIPESQNFTFNGGGYMVNACGVGSSIQ